MNALQINSAIIEVSSNSNGLFFDFRIMGILPGCRKSVLLSDSVSFRAINFRPLFGHNGSASVHPDDYRALVENAPVVSSKLFPVTITPEIERQTREYFYQHCSCPSVTDATNIHPDYIKAQRWSEVITRFGKNLLKKGIR